MTANEKRGQAGEPGERAGRRPVIYCVIPAELADQLHDPLRRHFREDPDVEVIVERRWRERRRGATDRRAVAGEPPQDVGEERRRIRAVGGRRVGERRARPVPVEAPELPRRARRHAEDLSFFARLEPAGESAEDLDTARVVARFQAGDSEAFGTLYSRYFDRVYGYLRVALRDRHEAEDATQDVFLRVFESLSGWEQRGKPFRHWLFVAVRNVAIDSLRRSGRLEPQDPHELGERVEDASEPEFLPVDWLTDRDLQVLVERLPLPQRQVLLLRYLFDLPSKDVATILGRTPLDVRKLQHRAVAFLRERLTALGRAPEGDYRTERWTRRLNQAEVLRERRWALWK